MRILRSLSRQFSVSYLEFLGPSLVSHKAAGALALVWSSREWGGSLRLLDMFEGVLTGFYYCFIEKYLQVLTLSFWFDTFRIYN